MLCDDLSWRHIRSRYVVNSRAGRWPLRLNELRQTHPLSLMNSILRSGGPLRKGEGMMYDHSKRSVADASGSFVGALPPRYGLGLWISAEKR
jgi:hypothetical protein